MFFHVSPLVRSEMGMAGLAAVSCPALAVPHRTVAGRAVDWMNGCPYHSPLPNRTWSFAPFFFGEAGHIPVRSGSSILKKRAGKQTVPLRFGAVQRTAYLLGDAVAN